MTIRILGFILLAIGVTCRPVNSAVPQSECALCIGHHGTCGCDLGHVVCCDGADAYGCSCR